MVILRYHNISSLPSRTPTRTLLLQAALITTFPDLGCINPCGLPLDTLVIGDEGRGQKREGEVGLRQSKSGTFKERGKVRDFIISKPIETSKKVLSLTTSKGYTSIRTLQSRKM